MSITLSIHTHNAYSFIKPNLFQFDIFIWIKHVKIYAKTNGS